MSEDIHEVAAWLREQAEADLAAADAATPGPWRDCGGYVTAPGPDAQVTDYGTQGDDQGAADSAHAARHDPLTEIARAESVLAVLDDRERTAAIASPAECPQGETASRDYLDALRELAAIDRIVWQLAAGYRHREGWKELRGVA